MTHCGTVFVIIASSRALNIIHLCEVKTAPNGSLAAHIARIAQKCYEAYHEGFKDEIHRNLLCFNLLSVEWMCSQR